MKELTKQLAEKAGFIFWENESWKPEGEVIDWSTSYDNEMEKLVELVVKECIDIVPWTHETKIKDHFGIE